MDNEQGMLCNAASESRDHLFFQCTYSRSAWNSLVRNFDSLRAFSHWEDMIDCLIFFPGNKKIRYLLILIWQALIYELWRERNDRLHRNRHSQADKICPQVKLLVKNRISAFRSENPQRASEIMQLWFSLS